MTGARKGNGVGCAPTIRVEQRNGVQFHAIDVCIKPERHRQGMKINIPVSQHHSFGIGAGAAGVEEFGQRIFVAFHDVGAVGCGVCQTILVILRRKPARLGRGIQQEKSLDVGNALAKRI